MLENGFQAKLIKELKKRFPGSDVLKNDEQYKPGVPDLILLWGTRWAMLECKKSMFEPYRPNQEYYLDRYDSMSYAFMICPENKEDVLSHLEREWDVR